VVVMTAPLTSIELARKALQSGAFDCITKPLKVDELRFCIERALDHQTAHQHSEALRPAIRDPYEFENLIGTSAKMQAIYRRMLKVAGTESTILIQGESGTGKELVARARSIARAHGKTVHS
jgi:two-component system, NtrC family, response regulator AtoC